MCRFFMAYIYISFSLEIYEGVFSKIDRFYNAFSDLLQYTLHFAKLEKSAISNGNMNFSVQLGLPAVI